MDGACAVKKREKKNRPAFFRFLPVRLSPEEAKRQIDDILRRYGESCSIIFREIDAEIKDSFLVDYGKDPRRIVRWATKIFDFFNIE